MGEHGVGGRVPKEIRKKGSHSEKIAVGSVAGQRAEFGNPVPNVPGRALRRKLSAEEKGPGFFIDPALNNPRRLDFRPDPERPVNHVKVMPGSFSTGPINTDGEDYGGTLEGGAEIISPGRELKIYENGGMGSFDGWIIEVDKDKDVYLLGTYGWWPQSRISKESAERNRRPKEAKPLRLFRRRS